MTGSDIGAYAFGVLADIEQHPAIAGDAGWHRTLADARQLTEMLYPMEAEPDVWNARREELRAVAFGAPKAALLDLVEIMQGWLREMQFRRH